ncbi:hypothetical protein ACPYPG_08275 [Streptomyces sp. FR-108]|uniref:hypothetical protein n=1 Tax=Streptomyces sp. FR-108 TaxID=3416665 RepID=UPI003CF5DE65
MTEQTEFSEEERDAYESLCPECGEPREVEWVQARTFGGTSWVKGHETCRNPKCPRSPDYDPDA